MPTRFALQRETTAHTSKTSETSETAAGSPPRFALKGVPMPPVVRTFFRRLSGDRLFAKRAHTFATNFTSRSSISASSTVSPNSSAIFSYGRERRAFSLSASHVAEPPQVDVRKEIDRVSELYVAAVEEMVYAEESKGSFYYIEDHQTAGNAVDECVCSYESLLKLALCEMDRDEVQSCLRSKVEQLRAQFDALPPISDLPLN